MSAYTTRLYDEYRRAAKTGQDAMDAAALENRDLTAAELETRDKAFAAVTQLKGEIDKIRTFETLREQSDIFYGGPRTVEAATGRSQAVTVRDLLRGAMDRGHMAVEFPMTSSTMTLRALQSAGGSAVETSFADFVTIFSRTFTPLLSGDVVTVLERPDGSPLVLPRLTADPAHGGTVTAEAAGINELDSTVSSITLAPFAYKVINLWSRELAEDSAIPLDNVIGNSTARELSIDIGAHLTTGTDSGQPDGILNSGTNGGTAVGTGATYGTYFGPTDLISLYYGLPAPARERASWLANSTTIAQIRNARATTGEHLWAPSLAAGAPETLLGRPLYDNPAMSNGSAAKAIALVDKAAYVVAMAPVRVESSIHFKYSTDQISLRTVFRVDGACVDVSGIRYLVNASV